MSIKNKVCSYLTYLFTGCGSLEAQAYTDAPVLTLGDTSVISEHAVQTISETPWLYGMFPELVESGALIVREGHFYVFGLAWSDILTNMLALVSFLILFWRTYYDVKRIKRDKTAKEK